MPTDRVLVVLASRDRNYALNRMLESAFRTSSQADIAVYIDDDQRSDYEATLLIDPRISYVYGPRIGPVASMNQLVRERPGYVAYGSSTDDSEFLTKNWDQWVLKTAREFPHGIGIMSPKLATSERMDYPWATAKWIETLGWFAWPGAHHFYWDILVELLGEAVGAIRYATAEEFAMIHDNVPCDDYGLKCVTDARNIVPVIGIERPQMIAKLKAAMQ